MRDFKNFKFLLIFTCLLGLTSSYGYAESTEDEEEEDTTEIEIYSEALRSYDGGRYMISKTFYEKLLQNYPGSPLAQSAELKIADCLFFADRYAEAIASYREFARVHNKHEAKPYALFQIGLAFQKSYQGTKQDQTPLKESVKQYVALVNEFPSSPYSKKASTQIIEAEEELLKAEIAVIEFYERTDDDSAAQKRKKELKKLFGHLPLYKEMYKADNEEIAEIEEAKLLVTPVAKVIPTITVTPIPVSSPVIEKKEPAEVKEIEIPPAPSESASPLPSALQASTIVKNNLKTLADLEAREKIAAKELAQLEPKGKNSIPDEPKQTFLLSSNCEYEMDVLKILLNFSSKPFLKSSHTEPTTGNSYSRIIFQEGFSTDALPAEYNDSRWIKRPSIKCLSTGDLEVSLQERIKITNSNDTFGPNSYLFVNIKSLKPIKISVVNGTKPTTLAIIAEE